MERLRGRVAVVTGAASGIGLALARRFGREGMKLVLADIDREALARAETELRKDQRDVVAVPTDVSCGADIQALADKAFASFGAVHVLCNNAGVGYGRPLWELSEAEWRWVIGVNLWSVVHGIRAFVPRMLAGGDEGHVVNTASMSAIVSSPVVGPYCATKHAVLAISETLHHELAMVGARLKVSVLCPSWVRTQIMDSLRVRPADVDPGEPSGRLAQGIETVRRGVEGGMDPNDVAGMVVDAVQNERFWIFTHPGSEMVAMQIANGMAAGRNPELLGR